MTGKARLTLVLAAIATVCFVVAWALLEGWTSHGDAQAWEAAGLAFGFGSWTLHLFP